MTVAETHRFLRAAAVIGAGAFALVWLYVAFAPLAFLDPEYPAWLAKTRFLAACDLGDVVIAGDSRAAADIQPALIATRTTNLALGGGEPIEAFVALRRAMRCPSPPRRVVLSFGIGHFVKPDLFWERSVAYRFLSFADLEELRLASTALHDTSIYDMHHTDGLAPRLRAMLYAARFPSLYFPSLLHGAVFLRLPENIAGLRRAERSRGQYFFGIAPGDNVVAMEGHLDRFHPLPVLDWYFDRTLAMLAAHGVEVDFVATPMNDSTWRSVRPEVAEAFGAYLRHYADRYPNLHIVGPLLPHWPDRYFGDSFSHLNKEGSARFSRAFAAWLSGQTLDPDTDLRSREDAQHAAEQHQQTGGFRHRMKQPRPAGDHRVHQARAVICHSESERPL